MKKFAAIFIFVCGLSLSNTSPIEIPKIELPKIELPKFEFPKFEFPKFDLELIAAKWYNPSVIDRKVVKAPAEPGKVQTQSITFDSVSRAIGAA